MLRSVNADWISKCYPRLPADIRNELVQLLADYAPGTPETEQSRVKLLFIADWHFPFLHTPADFDHEEFEVWTELAESQVMLKYKLSQDDLSMDPS
jgi:hypothetical protein